MYVQRPLVALFYVVSAGFLLRPSMCQLNRQDLEVKRVIVGLGGLVKLRCPRNAGLTLELLLNIYDDMARDLQPADCPRAKQVFVSMKDLIYSCIGSSTVDILGVLANHTDLVREYQYNFQPVCGPPDIPTSPVSSPSMKK